jgi:hypothetical protein
VASPQEEDLYFNLSKGAMTMDEEQKMEHNTNCNVSGHDEHLCFLIYQGWGVTNKTAYKALVDKAEYLCQKCTRTANSHSNLCEPVDL